MRHIFFAFPAGAAGIALLLFRLSASLWIAGTSGPALVNSFWQAALLFAAAFGLATGFATRVVSGIGVMVPLAVAAVSARYLTTAESGFILIAAGVTLIGPGAYSIDALLFGRRTVHLPD